jgi:hypothetical protein
VSASHQLYADFCHRHALPLHFQAWWLEAVSQNGSWNVAFFGEAQGQPQAALPWYETRRFGLKTIRPAPFTAYGGPIWLPQPATQRPDRRYAFEQKALENLYGQLPRVWHFRQHWQPGYYNWLPLYWKKYRQETRYTYLLNPQNEAALWAGLKNTVRTDIRKAQEQVEILSGPEHVETGYALYQQSAGRKGFDVGRLQDTFRMLHTELERRGHSTCLLARDRRNGEPQAALYLTHAAQRAGLLWSGLSAAHRHSCAGHLLLFEALRFAFARGIQTFDFEGSMDPGIEHLYRSFGGALTPYFSLYDSRFSK